MPRDPAPLSGPDADELTHVPATAYAALKSGLLPATAFVAWEQVGTRRAAVERSAAPSRFADARLALGMAGAEAKKHDLRAGAIVVTSPAAAAAVGDAAPLLHPPFLPRVSTTIARDDGPLLLLLDGRRPQLPVGRAEGLAQIARIALGMSGAGAIVTSPAAAAVGDAPLLHTPFLPRVSNSTTIARDDGPLLLLPDGRRSQLRAEGLAQIAAGHGGHRALLDRRRPQPPKGVGVLGLLRQAPMHSGACRIVEAVGAVATGGGRTRLFHSSAPVTQRELVGRVAALEVRADAQEVTSAGLGAQSQTLNARSKKLENRTFILEVRMAKVRFGLAIVQYIGISIAGITYLGMHAVYQCWDPVMVRAFWRDQAKKAAREAGTDMWNKSKKYVAETFTLSNASNAISRLTWGILGSSFEQQEKQRQAQLAEERRWQRFLNTRPAAESYYLSSYLYWVRENGLKAEERRQYKKQIDDAEENRRYHRKDVDDKKKQEGKGTKADEQEGLGKKNDDAKGELKTT